MAHLQSGWRGILAAEDEHTTAVSGPKVRVQGRLHKASQSYLITDSVPVKEAIRRARQYWLGIAEEVETEEIIFEGHVRVEEVMPPDFYALEALTVAPSSPFTPYRAHGLGFVWLAMFWAPKSAFVSTEDEAEPP